MDLSGIAFNPNHKLEAAAKDATTGLRLVLLAFVASLAALGLAMAATAIEMSGIWAWVGFGLSVVAFVTGAYGSYLAANALDWSGLITGVIVLSTFVPYLQFICFIVLLSNSISLIQKAGYRVSLFGPLRKRVAR